MDRDQNPPGKRDLRIDLLRGLALFVIFIDHSVFPPLASFKWLADLTFHRYFWIDCADVFIFLSGYVAGTVYSIRHERFGLLRCLRDAGRRCAELYAAHLLLFTLCLAVVEAASIRHLELPAMLSRPYTLAPLATSRNVLTLSSDEPFLLSLLPLYIVFIALTPFAVALAYRSRVLVFSLCFGLWAVVQLCQEQLELGPMDVRAWQFLFFSAVLLANQNVRNPGWWKPLLRRRGWAVAGLAVVTLSRLLPTKPVSAFLHSHILLDWIPRTLPFMDKQTLGPLRIVNIALFVLFMAAFDWFPIVLKSRVSQMITTCGQSSLTVYCVGVVLNYLGIVFIVVPGGGKLAQLLWIVCGSLILAAAGFGWKRLRDAFAWRMVLPQLVRTTTLMQRAAPPTSLAD